MSFSTPLIEHIRRRPGMYIGGTDSSALNRCVFELIAHSIEEHLAGRGATVTVTIHHDGSLSVKDKGGGIPVLDVPQFNKPFIELALTEHHVPDTHREFPFTVLGTCGVGTRAVNALSEWMRVNTVWEGNKYQMAFERGRVSESFAKLGPSGEDRGTTVHFKPDAEIFRTVTFDRNFLASRLDQLAILHCGLEFWLIDERLNSARRPLVSLFHYPNGIADFLRITHSNDLWLPPGPVAVEREAHGMKIALAFQFTETGVASLSSFVNSRPTHLGGTHVQGFLQGLADGLNAIATRPVFSQPQKLRLGLDAIIGVWLAEPRYNGSFKEELLNPEVEMVAQEVTRKGIFRWATNDQHQAEQLVRWLKELHLKKSEVDQDR